MATGPGKDDSLLSIAANITGIMTFGVAILGAAWLWLDAFRKAEEEIHSVDNSRELHDREFQWMVQSLHTPGQPLPGRPNVQSKIVEIEALLKPLKVVSERRRNSVDRMNDDLMKNYKNLQEQLPRPLFATPTLRHSGPVRGMEPLSATSAIEAIAHFIPFPFALIAFLFNFSFSIALAVMRFIWLPFRARTLEVMTKIDEMRTRKLFIQSALLDVRLTQIELRAAVHEELLVEIWQMVKDMRDGLEARESMTFRGRTQTAAGNAPRPRKIRGSFRRLRLRRADGTIVADSFK